MKTIFMIVSGHWKSPPTSCDLQPLLKCLSIEQREITFRFIDRFYEYPNLSDFLGHHDWTRRDGDSRNRLFLRLSASETWTFEVDTREPDYWRFAGLLDFTEREMEEIEGLSDSLQGAGLEVEKVA